MSEASNTWTDERVELLKVLWSQGLSASRVAAELGQGVTRNAVIGKCIVSVLRCAPASRRRASRASEFPRRRSANCRHMRRERVAEVWPSPSRNRSTLKPRRSPN